MAAGPGAREVAALEVRECAKPWSEADADVCEAIDYLEYYARAALELDRGGSLLQVPGERNELVYAGRGVAAIIAPWNFPVAIPMGMTAAAIVAGNAAILKPAEQSPACGAIVVDALRAGGVPDAVVGLLPGDGEVGAALVAHRDVAVIAFTGSLAVGLEVVRAAAEVAPGPTPAETGRRRVRRKELHHRRARCGSRRGGSGDHRLRLLLRRPEVLGGFAGAGG